MGEVYALPACHRTPAVAPDATLRRLAHHHPSWPFRPKPAHLRPRASSPTPAMRQYLDAKQQHRDAIVFFRMGDFYEMFYEDALVGRARARADADLAVEGRQRRRHPDVRRAVPRRSTATSRGWCRKGFRVAICDQVEDPKQGQRARQARGRARRLARHADRRQLPRRARAGVPDGARARRTPGPRFGVALLDLSTGEFTAAEYAGADGLQALADELAVLRPREIVVPARVRPSRAASPQTAARRGVAVTTRRRLDVRARVGAPRRCSISCGRAALEGFGLDRPSRRRSRPPARSSHYLRDTQKADLAHVRAIALPRSAPTRCSSIRRRCSISRSSRARRAAAHGSLLDELDRTVTSMGSRLLRAWLLRPLVALERIRDRLDAVEELAFRTTERGKFRDALKAVQDLERLVARAALGTAGPRDLVGLQAVARRRPARARCCSPTLQAPLVARLLAGSSTTSPTCATRIERTLIDEPPALARDGGFIRDGVDAELDELRTISRSGKQVIAEMEERERARTGIALAEGPLQPRLRLLHRDLEVEPARRAGRLPPQADDRRRRALHHAGAEGIRREGARRRRADPRARARDLRARCAARVAAEAPRIQDDGARARHARRARRRSPRPPRVDNYTKPHVHDGDELHRRPTRAIRSSSGTSRDAFVPNDVALNGTRAPARHPDRAEHGRQVDLPAADGAALPDGAGRLVRAGARGEDRRSSIASSRASARRTTSRAASRRSWSRCRRRRNILHTATSRSLVVLDEIGRGTATFDGLSIAWAVAEHLATQPARAAEDALRHALSRADRPRRRAARASSTSTSRRASGRTTSSSCARSCRADPIAATASRSRGSPACRAGHRARARDPDGARARRAAARRPARRVSGTPPEPQQQLGLFQQPRRPITSRSGCDRRTSIA